MLQFRFNLLHALSSDIEDGAILVYDEASQTIKGTKIIIKEDDDDDSGLPNFPQKILKLEGEPLGNDKKEYLIYDNKTEKMVYSNQELSSGKGLVIDGTPLGNTKIEYLVYNNSNKMIAYSNKELSSGKDLVIDGTPLGNTKIEYLVYNNSNKMIAYSNKEMTARESLEIEGTPLGGNKVEYLVYDNNTEKIIYSNKELLGKYFFYATLQNDLTDVEFNPIIFNNIVEDENNIYNINKIIIPEDGVYRIEITLDCIFLSNVDIPSDTTTTIKRVRNSVETTLAEKIYSINQIGETKFVKTEVLLSFEKLDEISISVISTAIDKGITIKKSSSLICYKYK